VLRKNLSRGALLTARTQRRVQADKEYESAAAGLSNLLLGKVGSQRVYDVLMNDSSTEVSPVLDISRINSHLQKLLLLESRCRRLGQYPLREPWDWRGDLADTFGDLQALAKNVAAFLGLENVTFTVAVARQRRDVGGHIELLQNQKEVFIEVDDDLLRHPLCVPAVVCHEVMHKLLYDAGIWLHDDIENEMLTDVSCVYAGLGKFMLNGSRSTGYNSGHGGQTNLRVGYVPLEELAFDYVLVCQMRGIGSEESEGYVSGDAIEFIRYWRSELGPLIEISKGAARLETRIGRVVEKIQSDLCGQDQDLRTALKHLREAKDRITSLHRMMNSAQVALERLKNGPTNGTDFLMGVRAMYLDSSINTVDTDPEITLKIARLCHELSTEVPVASPLDGSEIIECPIDGTKLRVPTGKAKIKIACPKCKYRFLASTSLAQKRSGLSSFFR
jgi:hypothetical protein